MAKQTVNIGVSANDNTGDPLRSAFDKLNDNFDEVYAAGPVGTNLQISSNTVASTNTNGNVVLDPAGTGSVKVEGPMIANGVVTINSTVTGNLVPTTAGTYNLGSSAAPYKELYVSGSSLHLGNLVLKEVDTMVEIFRADGVTNAILSGNSTTAGSVLNNGETVVALTNDGPITFYANNYSDGAATTTVINTGNITTPALVATGNVTGGNLITTGLVSSTGNVAGGNLTTAGVVTATGNITGGNISGGTGAVAATTGTFTNIAGTLTTATQASITSVGTLTALTATGNVAGGNLTTAGVVTATGTITGGNLTTAGTITGATVASGNVTVGDDNITFTDDSSVQTTAYKPHSVYLTADRSTISSSLTDMFGTSLTTTAGKIYEVYASVKFTNSSTGNPTLAIVDGSGDAHEILGQITVGSQQGTITESYLVNGAGSFVTASQNTSGDKVAVFFFSFRANSTGTLQIHASVDAGTLTPKAGSVIRFTEYAGATVGSVS